MTFLNQIFYSCNKFDNPSKLEKLHSHMLTTETYNNIIESLQSAHSLRIEQAVPRITVEHINNIEEVCSPNITNEIQSVAEEKHIIQNRNPIIFYPQKENTLFWCVYIAHYGQDEFHMIGNRYQNHELDEKQKIIQFIKKSPQKIKASNHKVTNIMIQELLSALMIQKMASLQDCIVYSIFYNKDIYVVKHSVYLFYHNKESENVTTENTIIIYCKNEREYGIELEVNAEKIADIVNNKIRICSTEKPLKSMTEYKTPDLEKMATILGIAHGKKKEMYDSIIEKCNWNI